MKPEKIRGLCEALHHWLSFQILCGREALLGESYLNQPTGEYLLNAAGSSHLKTEHSHPILNREQKRGRPRQIDFCLLSRDSKQLTTAIELKWITQSSVKQRIIDDLLRLECLLPEHKGQHIYRYLVVAGRTNDLRGKFFETEMNIGNGRMIFIDGVLGTATNQTVKVTYKDLGAEQKALFDKFAANYQSPVPKRFLTTLVHGQESEDIGVYCWRIQSSKNRKVIKHDQGGISTKTADPS